MKSNKMVVIFILIVLTIFASACAFSFLPKNGSDSATLEYEGNVLKITLPQDGSVNEANSSHEDESEFVYINTPIDGSFITITASTVPYEEMTWDEGKEMYERYLVGKGAENIKQYEMEDAAYPNTVIITREQAQSAESVMEVNVINIVFLAGDKLCTIVGMSAEKEHFSEIENMCGELFSSFELV